MLTQSFSNFIDICFCPFICLFILPLNYFFSCWILVKLDPFKISYKKSWASQVLLVVKSLPASEGHIRHTGFIDP